MNKPVLNPSCEVYIKEYTYNRQRHWRQTDTKAQINSKTKPISCFDGAIKPQFRSRISTKRDRIF